jgi:hypothetical protein
VYLILTQLLCEMIDELKLIVNVINERIRRSLEWYVCGRRPIDVFSIEGDSIIKLKGRTRAAKYKIEKETKSPSTDYRMREKGCKSEN